MNNKSKPRGSLFHKHVAIFLSIFFTLFNIFEYATPLYAARPKSIYETALEDKGASKQQIYADAASLGRQDETKRRPTGRIAPVTLTSKEIEIINKAKVGALGRLKKADGSDVQIQPYSSELNLYARLQARHPDFKNDEKIEQKLDLGIAGKNVLVIPGYSINGFILAEEGAKSVTVYDADPNTIAWLKAIKKFWHHREVDSNLLMLSVGEAFMANTDLNSTSKLSAKGRLPKALTTTGYMVKLIKEAMEIYYSDPDKNAKSRTLPTELKSNITFRQGDIEKISRDLAVREPYDFVYVPWILGKDQDIRKEKRRTLRVLKQIRQVSSPNVRIMITPSDADLAEMLEQAGYKVQEDILGLEQNYLVATPEGAEAKSLGTKDLYEVTDLLKQLNMSWEEFEWEHPKLLAILFEDNFAMEAFVAYSKNLAVKSQIKEVEELFEILARGRNSEALYGDVEDIFGLRGLLYIGKGVSEGRMYKEVLDLEMLTKVAEAVGSEASNVFVILGDIWQSVSEEPAREELLDKEMIIAIAEKFKTESRRAFWKLISLGITGEEFRKEEVLEIVRKVEYIGVEKALLQLDQLNAEWKREAEKNTAQPEEVEEPEWLREQVDAKSLGAREKYEASELPEQLDLSWEELEGDYPKLVEILGEQINAIETFVVYAGNLKEKEKIKKVEELFEIFVKTHRLKAGFSLFGLRYLADRFSRQGENAKLFEFEFLAEVAEAMGTMAGEAYMRIAELGEAKEEVGLRIEEILSIIRKVEHEVSRDEVLMQLYLLKEEWERESQDEALTQEEDDEWLRAGVEGKSLGAERDVMDQVLQLRKIILLDKIAGEVTTMSLDDYSRLRSLLWKLKVKDNEAFKQLDILTLGPGASFFMEELLIAWEVQNVVSVGLFRESIFLGMLPFPEKELSRKDREQLLESGRFQFHEQSYLDYLRTVPDNSFDLVYTRGSLEIDAIPFEMESTWLGGMFYLYDVYKELYRILRPGGVIMNFPYGGLEEGPLSNVLKRLLRNINFEIHQNELAQRTTPFSLIKKSNFRVPQYLGQPTYQFPPSNNEVMASSLGAKEEYEKSGLSLELNLNWRELGRKYPTLVKILEEKENAIEAMISYIGGSTKEIRLEEIDKLFKRIVQASEHQSLNVFYTLRYLVAEVRVGKLKEEVLSVEFLTRIVEANGESSWKAFEALTDFVRGVREGRVKEELLDVEFFERIVQGSGKSSAHAFGALRHLVRGVREGRVKEELLDVEFFERIAQGSGKSSAHAFEALSKLVIAVRAETVKKEVLSVEFLVEIAETMKEKTGEGFRKVEELGWVKIEGEFRKDEVLDIVRKAEKIGPDEALAQLDKLKEAWIRQFQDSSPQEGLQEEEWLRAGVEGKSLGKSSEDSLLKRERELKRSGLAHESREWADYYTDLGISYQGSNYRSDALEAFQTALEIWIALGDADKAEQVSYEIERIVIAQEYRTIANALAQDLDEIRTQLPPSEALLLRRELHEFLGELDANTSQEIQNSLPRVSALFSAVNDRIASFYMSSVAERKYPRTQLERVQFDPELSQITRYIIPAPPPNKITFQDQLEPLVSFAFDLDRNRIAIQSQYDYPDSSVISVWHINQGARIYYESRGRGPREAYFISPRGNKLILNTHDGEINYFRIHSLDPDEDVTKFNINGASFQLDREGPWTERIGLARDRTKDNYYLYDLRKNVPLVGPLDFEAKQFVFADFSRDGSHILTMSSDGTVTIWPLKLRSDYKSLASDFPEIVPFEGSQRTVPVGNRFIETAEQIADEYEDFDYDLRELRQAHHLSPLDEADFALTSLTLSPVNLVLQSDDQHERTMHANRRVDENFDDDPYAMMDAFEKELERDDEEVGSDDEINVDFYGFSLGSKKQPKDVAILDYLKKSLNVFIDGKDIENFSLAQLDEIFKLAARNPKQLRVVVTNAPSYDKHPLLNLPNIYFTPQSEKEAAKGIRKAQHNIHLSRIIDPSEDFTLVGDNKFRYPNEENGLLGVALLYTQSENPLAFLTKYGLRKIDGFFSAVGEALLALVQTHEADLAIARAA